MLPSIILILAQYLVRFIIPKLIFWPNFDFPSIIPTFKFIISTATCNSLFPSLWKPGAKLKNACGEAGVDVDLLCILVHYDRTFSWCKVLKQKG